MTSQPREAIHIYVLKSTYGFRENENRTYGTRKFSCMYEKKGKIYSKNTKIIKKIHSVT